MENERGPRVCIISRRRGEQGDNNAKYRVKVNGNGIPYAKLKE